MGGGVEGQEIPSEWLRQTAVTLFIIVGILRISGSN